VGATGHGDFFPARAGAGVLGAARAAGYRWAFVSNVDNLGAVLDPAILAHVARAEAPFAMEVADRSAADSKGGHLARRVGDGALVLREIAQTPTPTGTRSLTPAGTATSTPTACGSTSTRSPGSSKGGRGHSGCRCSSTARPSIRLIRRRRRCCSWRPRWAPRSAHPGPGAGALRVPRSRFLPVKTTGDLLGLRSDAYVLLGDGGVRLAAGRVSAPRVTLSASYVLLGGFDGHFPAGPPSLLAAESVTGRGSVTFAAEVAVHGEVTVDEAMAGATVPAATVLDG